MKNMDIQMVGYALEVNSVEAFIFCCIKVCIYYVQHSLEIQTNLFSGSFYLYFIFSDCNTVQ